MVIKRIILLFLLCSCAVVGPKSEKKSPLNYLNGKNYEVGHHSPVTVNGIPLVLKRKKRVTTLQGECHFKMDDGFRSPIKFQKIYLFQKGKLMAYTNTTGSGMFEIKKYLENGRYILRFENKKYIGEKVIEISKYDHTGINLEVRKK